MHVCVATTPQPGGQATGPTGTSAREPGCVRGPGQHKLIASAIPNFRCPLMQGCASLYASRGVKAHITLMAPGGVATGAP